MMTLRRTLLAALAVIVLGWLSLRGCVYLAVDQCLDAGGAWNYERGLCEGID